MAYAWIITHDKIDDGSAVGVGGNTAGVAPFFGQPPEVQSKGRRFRMVDDDDEVYYLGLIVTGGPAGCIDDFAPLDDFGTPNAGCTMIEYYENGKWVTL